MADDLPRISPAKVSDTDEEAEGLESTTLNLGPYSSHTSTSVDEEADEQRMTSCSEPPVIDNLQGREIAQCSEAAYVGCLRSC